MNEYYVYRKMKVERDDAERRACKRLVEQEALARQAAERQGAGNEKAQPSSKEAQLRGLRFWFLTRLLALCGVFGSRFREPICAPCAPRTPFNAR